MQKNNTLSVSKLQLKTFNQEGFIVIKKFLTISRIKNLKRELIIATELNLKADKYDKGMVHNCFLYGKNLLNLLQLKQIRFFTDYLLCANSIIYAYQSSSLGPGSTNYGSRIHKDTPRFIPNYRTNIGLIIPLDKFTVQNGGTQVLPGSHLDNKIPSKINFEKNKLTIKSDLGDVIFFDANLFHRAGVNKSNEWRYALTINFCRPFMRSRFDFPKLIKDNKLKLPANKSLLKYLGYDVQMPSSLNEFYLPEKDRLYKPNQESI